MSASMYAAPSFSIRRAIANDADTLFGIWWRSVRATHTFLTEADFLSLAPQVRALKLATLDTWVLQEVTDGAVGFLVVGGSSIQSLFIAPEWLRCGAGTLLLRHARGLYGRLSVEVNEQNTPAVEFYLARGFSVMGRSNTDDAGRPFPLLHLSEVRVDTRRATAR